MVLKRASDPSAIRKYLQYKMDQYLRGRSAEKKKEMPLLLVENQGYIHYNKGSLAMYALQDYIGEDNVNHALAIYVRDYKFQQAPFTNSLELINYIKEVVPDSLRYVITDLFEAITLFENKAVNAAYTEKDGKF
ncbi:MAG: hypothetical protein QME74_09125 [Candidatus Edwardsbacteria bacterium]|nr:hypothetical protein [Candidatus Edwardsbacteria bacterium]